MKDKDDTIFSTGIVFLISVLLIISGILAAVILNAPEEREKEGENNWQPPPYHPYIPPTFSGVIAEHFVVRQLEFGHRVPGTIQHDNCRDFIRETMKGFGYTVCYQNFTWNGTSMSNIIATNGFRGNYYPSPSAKTLILGAHYDTRPYSERDPEVNAPIMGANDGASGVAVLLELARVLSVHPVNLTTEFVFFDGEDTGFEGWQMAQGSRVFTENLTGAEKRNITGAIVVDMVGDRNLDIYYENSSDPEMREAIWHEAEKLNYREFHRTGKGTIFDDHSRLEYVGISSVLIIDFDYPYWHTQQDTLDKVSGESMEKVGRVVEKYIYTISDYTGKEAKTSELQIPQGETRAMGGGVVQINGDILIKGTLRLKDTMLIVNAREGHEHSLRIANGGGLIMENSTLAAPGAGIVFTDYGKLTAEDSIIEQLWGDTQSSPNAGGVQIYSGDFSFLNSTVRLSMTRGVFIRDSTALHSPAFINCTITDNGEVGLYLYNASLSVENTVFERNGRGGIRVYRGSIEVENCTFGLSYERGSCSSGSCGPPSPSYGIFLSEAEGENRISGGGFSEVDYGISAEQLNSSGGQIEVRDVRMNGLKMGMLFINSAGTLKDSEFNGTGIAVYSLKASPVITGNSIRGSETGIYLKESGGGVERNRISDSKREGIYLENTSTVVRDNIITGSGSGVHIRTPCSSEVRGNALLNNTDGLYIALTGSSMGGLNITKNLIAGNDWGIRVMGNSSLIDTAGNQFEMSGTANLYGILKEEREVVFRFRNQTAPFFLNITRDGKLVYNESLSIWQLSTTVNLTTRVLYSNLTVEEFTDYTATVSRDGTNFTREFNPAEEESLIFDFPREVS